MEETKSCLLSYALDGQGGAKFCDLPSVTEKDPRLVWIHLNGRHPDARKFLQGQMKLDPVVIKSILAEETRPRLEENESGAMLIFRGINFNPGPVPEDLVSVRIWVSGSMIITVSRRKSKAIADLDDRIKQNRGPRSVGEFVSILCACLNDGIEPAIQEIEDRIDHLEEVSLENPDVHLRQDLSAVRKQATMFRRHLSPQRDVIVRLEHSDHAWMVGSHKWFMQDNADRITRIVEDLDAARERAQILQDEVTGALSARLNKNLYVLSVITAIFMPLTFLSGLLGMNVSGIPAAESPYAFAAVCAIAFVVGLVQIFIFRRLKWI